MGCATSSQKGNAGDLEHFVGIDYNGRVQDDYEVLDRVGTGQQGTVYRVRSFDTNEIFAMKETHIGAFGANAKRREAYCEIETLGKMKHPNVVSLIKAYQTSAEVHVVMEYCGSNTLLSYLVAMDDAEWFTAAERGEIKHALLRQLVDAVAHVHSRDVVFRDLKFENLMVAHDDHLRNVQLKLVDFGRAASLRRSDRLNNQVPLGTSLFQAPEVEQRREYGQAADMWAVGVFAYFLTTGRMPFEHSVSGLYKVFRGEYDPMDGSVSKHARDLVSKLLVVDAAKRINAAQASTHKYLRQAFESHIHVAAGEALRVPHHMINAAKKQLRALVMQESLERHTVGLLAEKLTPEDLKTLRRWLNMKAERSIRRGTANLRLAHVLQDEVSNASPNDSMREGRQYADEIKAQTALNTLYKELAATSGSNSVESSFHDGRLSKVQSFSNLADAMGKVMEDDANAVQASKRKTSPHNDAKPPKPSSKKKASPQKAKLSPTFADKLAAVASTSPSNPHGGEDDDDNDDDEGRSFVGVAHSAGMCTVDELISACISAGLGTVADELQNVRDTLKAERAEMLKKLGTDAETRESSVLLDIMLFRHEDLLSKVENIQLQRVKDLSMRGGTNERVFEGSVVATLAFANNATVTIGERTTRRISENELTQENEYMNQRRMSVNSLTDKSSETSLSRYAVQRSPPTS